MAGWNEEIKKESDRDTANAVETECEKGNISAEYKVYPCTYVDTRALAIYDVQSLRMLALHQAPRLLLK